MPNRLLMLGLDGLGADVVLRLADKGIVPNLAALIAEGSFGALRATVPPITGPSWLGVSTGLDVDQTGVADFLVNRSPLFDLRPIGAREFRGRAVWDYAGAVGLRTCVFNFPILFPPYDANGIMVSGFGTDESTQWTSPESLKSELTDVVGRDYNLAVNYHAEQYDDVERFLTDIEASLDRRVRAAEWLLRREAWDLAVCMFSETDWLMHRCWNVLFPESNEDVSDVTARICRRARAVFARLDAAIPRLLDAMGPGASLLICSDHGFGTNTSTFSINAALEQSGLLLRRPASQRGSAGVRRAGVRLAQRAGAVAARVPGPVGRTLARARRRARRLLPKDDSAYLSTVIDLEASVVLDPGHTIPFGGLYVGTGIERGSSAYDVALERVRAFLDDTAAREHVTFDVRRPWLEAGGKTTTLPDVIVSGDEWGMTFSKTSFDGPLLVPGPFSPRHTGSHRMSGMYLTAGPLFGHTDEHELATVLDVAPTILACFGIAAPTDRRGGILSSFLGDRSALSRAPEIHSHIDSGPTSDDDESDVRDRLRGLGYIE